MKLRWRFGIVAAIFLAIFCLYPQLKMFYLRGSEWNGHYAYNDIDEVAYASYVRALIDGRPRKNDPYSGRDDSPQTPQPESLFSIQFAAPYSIAIPARILGIGTPWAMTFSGALAGFIAALAGFWLIARMTGSNWYGMAGSLVVFAGGAVFAGEGAMPEIFYDGFSYPYFPGFRRYIPAMAMAAVFGVFAVVWKLLSTAECGVRNAESPGNVERGVRNAESPGNAERGVRNAESPGIAERGVRSAESPGNAGRGVRNAESVGEPPIRSSTLSGSTELGRSDSALRIPHSALDALRVPRSALLILAAVVCFAYTVYSYFYIWTTAAAWLGCLFLTFLIFRPEGFRRDLTTLAVIGAGCVASLLPYAWMLSMRSETLDHVQLLVFSREPDLWRMPEYISVVCLLLIAAGVARKILEPRDRATLFALSLSLVPLIVFNQQIITGRSLQPIHYQVFIGNYVAGLALVVTIGLLFREHLSRDHYLTKAVCSAVLLVAIGWGFVECHYTVRVLDDANIERDLALPVAKRLEELARDDIDPHRSTVLAYDMLQADDLPTVAPQNVLWARHQHVFAGMNWDENKERYFQYLYYMNVDERGLDHLLKNDFVGKIALFGWGRHTDRLSSQAKPLTYGEIDREVRRYAAYRAGFNAGNATNPLLSYAVVNNRADTDLTNLDKWYERGAGEVIGQYTLYKLRLRSAPAGGEGPQPSE
jgi:hypothetical protein